VDGRMCNSGVCSRFFPQINQCEHCTQPNTAGLAAIYSYWSAAPTHNCSSQPGVSPQPLPHRTHALTAAAAPHSRAPVQIGGKKRAAACSNADVSRSEKGSVGRQRMDGCRVEHSLLSRLVKHVLVSTQQRTYIFRQLLRAFVVRNSAAGEVGCAAQADVVAHEHHARLKSRTSSGICYGLVDSSSVATLILALFHRNLYANSQQIIYTSTILPDCHLPPRVALVAVDKGEQLKRRQARHSDNDRLHAHFPFAHPWRLARRNH
jgi:hypothetical protein